MIRGKQDVNERFSEGKPKSWKQVMEERKTLKKQRKQAKLIKTLEESKEVNLENEMEKPQKAVRKPNPSTISIAVPGSILDNAQSVELRSYLAGQIARAACIFRVNEIIVFDDIGITKLNESRRDYNDDDVVDDGVMESKFTMVHKSCLQLARILQYLECPQYLRKFFFPLHNDLKYCGLLNPLDAPHHLRQQNNFCYREGVVTNKKAKADYCYINVGLLNDVLVDTPIAEGVRVTVKLQAPNDNMKKLRGSIVSPDEPRCETGVYWGYTVRIAHNFTEIFTKSPYKGGYDLSIGTSDRGVNVHDVSNKSYCFKHMLVVFGGLKGLEQALANDDKINIEDPASLFDHYVNVLPKQGSRTIRTEEAILIAMAALQEKLKPEIVEPDINLDEFLPRSEDTGINQQYAHMRQRQQIEEHGNKPKKRKKIAISDHENDKVNETVPLKHFNKHEKEVIASKMDLNDDEKDFEIVSAIDKKVTLKLPTESCDLDRFD